jgi:uncharacterized protein (DUF697 family)
MPRKRPEFSLPSTKPAPVDEAKTEWVFRSDAAVNEAAPPPSVAVSSQERDRRVRGTLDLYASYAAAAGFIPIPLVDVVAIGSLQLKMIAELCAIHDVAFNNKVGKSLLAVLVGSVGTTALAYQVGRSVIKVIPIVGAVVMPAMGYGATRAIGTVFARHLQSGGTLDNVDMTEMRGHLQQELAAPVR